MDVIQELEATLAEARAKLEQAEAVAAIVPRLRREIKVLERTVAQMRDGDAERRPRTGPSIKEQIAEAVASSGGLEFTAGKMLPTVCELVDGKKKSVQVELHRMIRTGELIAGRDLQDRPVSLSLPDAAIVSLDERREG